MEVLRDQLDLLTRLLHASEVRQRVIGQNIANVNTPGYQRLDVDFESELARELSSRSSRTSGRTAEPRVIRGSGGETRGDGNNVDIDMEIGQLNKNALLQQVWLQVMGTELSMMRRAIDGR